MGSQLLSMEMIRSLVKEVSFSFTLRTERCCDDFSNVAQIIYYWCLFQSCSLLSPLPSSSNSLSSRLVFLQNSIYFILPCFHSSCSPVSLSLPSAPNTPSISFSVTTQLLSFFSLALSPFSLLSSLCITFCPLLSPSCTKLLF